MVKSSFNNDRIYDKRILTEAKEQCERIIDTAENDMPDAGFEFAESVAEKTRSILESIEERQIDYVTKNQLASLDNMESGLARWHRD